jgi:hypothetical protein
LVGVGEVALSVVCSGRGVTGGVGVGAGLSITPGVLTTVCALIRAVGVDGDSWVLAVVCAVEVDELVSVVAVVAAEVGWGCLVAGGVPEF